MKNRKSKLQLAIAASAFLGFVGGAPVSAQAENCGLIFASEAAGCGGQQSCIDGAERRYIDCLKRQVIVYE